MPGAGGCFRWVLAIVGAFFAVQAVEYSRAGYPGRAIGAGLLFCLFAFAVLASTSARGRGW